MDVLFVGYGGMKDRGFVNLELVISFLEGIILKVFVVVKIDVENKLVSVYIYVSKVCESWRFSMLRILYF